jgi:hypothetical protein
MSKDFVLVVATSVVIQDFPVMGRMNVNVLYLHLVESKLV